VATSRAFKQRHAEGITLRFTGQAVRFVGRNLNREMRSHLKLFEDIVRHRIPWIREGDEPTAITAAILDFSADFPDELFKPAKRTVLTDRYLVGSGSSNKPAKYRKFSIFASS
jgi:hypothetical protein